MLPVVKAEDFAEGAVVIDVNVAAGAVVPAGAGPAAAVIDGAVVITGAGSGNGAPTDKDGSTICGLPELSN